MSVGLTVLGGVEARIDGRAVALGPARQQSVLAGLLVEVNRRVSVARLVERVWGGDPPRRARQTLASYVSRLRHLLPAAAGVSIAYQLDSYRLSVDEAAVDLHRFRQLVRRATAAEATAESTVALVSEALSLWRGEPFAGLDSDWLHAVRESLYQEWYAAELALAEGQLALGGHDAVVARLSPLVAARPLDERLTGAFMLALHRADRTSDALRHYHRLRSLLADQLGADPGAPLQRLHLGLLGADPMLAAPLSRPPRPGRGSDRPVPHQLPARPGSFVGRARELALLSAALCGPASAGTTAVSAIDGLGGSGKTWLALRWAYTHLDEFPDGQLYVDLGGFSPTEEPVPVQSALRTLLGSLGVPPAAVPDSLAARIGLYRTLVAGRRMLFLLDDARDTDQVVPLLPAGPGCAVLVTSRHRLPGLAAGYGARSVTLDEMPRAEAGRLLTRHLGAPRTAAEPAATGALLDHCAGLPLALSIVATRAAGEPDRPLAALVADLRDARTRLDGLDTGDPAASVRAAFETSYRVLDAASARVFRLLGLATGPDIGLPAAASLTGLGVERTRRSMRALERASLVSRGPHDRYRIHDLVRLFAAELADDDAELGPAAARLVDHYLQGASAAGRLGDPRPDLPRPRDGASGPRFDDAAAARVWLDIERRNILAAVDVARELGLSEPARWLAHLLNRRCDGFRLLYLPTAGAGGAA